MPIELIMPGVPTVLLQNVVYCLPIRKCHILMQPNCEIAQSAGGPWITQTGPTEGFESSAGYIRCTTANAVVTCAV